MPKLACSALPIAILLIAAPALAGGNGTYRAELAQPVTTSAIVRDIRWACVGATCTAPRTATSPDANVCASVARRLGRLTAFSAADRAFGPAEIERCNAAAPAIPAN